MSIPGWLSVTRWQWVQRSRSWLASKRETAVLTVEDTRLNRIVTTASVLLVAAIAAVVSFVHIEHLSVTHGQTYLASVLLPLSIDGTVAAMSGVMLRAARCGMRTPWLARGMLGLAVMATLAANVAYGVTYGWMGALISGWPAVAFVGCVEVSIGMVRRTRRVTPQVAEPQPEPPKWAYVASVPVADAPEPAQPVTQAPAPSRQPRQRQPARNAGAERSRRYRLHSKGDHSACLKGNCPDATPAMVDFKPEPVPAMNGHAP